MELPNQSALLEVIRSIQADALEERPPHEVFDGVLKRWLDLTDSGYGFIGEILSSDDGLPYLKTHAITNLAWNDETRRFFAENAPSGLEFRDLDTLFGYVIRTGEPLLSNDPANDVHAGGLPDGHPALTAFLGLPFYHGAELVGMAGIANRAGGYDADLLGFLAPLTATCGQLIHVYRAAAIRSEIEQQKRDLEDQLHHAQKLQTIGELTGGIAHDFNNILASILGYTNLALDHFGADDRLARYLKEVATAGERGRDLVRQMLIFSRGGSPEARLLDLPENIEQAIRLMRPILPAGIDVRVRASRAIKAWIDPVQLEQVLLNLSINARDAMDGRGVLGIEVDQGLASGRCASCKESFQGRFVQVGVFDDGIGIAPEERARIFEPFYTSKETGSGMGLAVVHGVIHRHGGHIVLDSSPSGTCFRMFLPESEGREEAAMTAVEPPLGLHRASDARVVVVDDEAAIASLLGEILEARGYEVSVFQSPTEAWRAMRDAPDAVDLLVTDLTMPEMTGEELIARVRGLRSDLPVILCSGYLPDRDDSVIKELGRAVFLPKPIEVGRLLELMDSLCAPRD